MIDTKFLASRIPEDHEGPVPSGGIGGTRRGVKCLHAHYACFLAGEDDPVGKWVHHQLGFGLCRLELNDPETTVMIEGTTFSIPTQISAINERLSHGSYADPAELTNIIGEITDAFDDALRINDVGRPHDIDLAITGPHGQGLARLESGSVTCEHAPIDRDTAEELFRLLATDNAADRVDHPGLLQTDGDLLGAVCVVVASGGSLTQHRSISARRPRHDSIPTPSLESSNPVGQPSSTAPAER